MQLDKIKKLHFRKHDKIESRMRTQRVYFRWISEAIDVVEMQLLLEFMKSLVYRSQSLRKMQLQAVKDAFSAN